MPAMRMGPRDHASARPGSVTSRAPNSATSAMRQGGRRMANHRTLDHVSLFHRKSLDLPTADTALPGRDREMPVPDRHDVLGTPLRPPFPDGLEQAVFGLGCFWGAERKFWQLDGVYTTAAGYA